MPLEVALVNATGCPGLTAIMGGFWDELGSGCGWLPSVLSAFSIEIKPIVGGSSISSYKGSHDHGQGTME